MIGPPPSARVWLACGHTDVRKGTDGLALLAQEVLKEDPFGGAVFAFRGKRGGRVTFYLPAFKDPEDASRHLVDIVQRLLGACF